MLIHVPRSRTIFDGALTLGASHAITVPYRCAMLSLYVAGISLSVDTLQPLLRANGSSTAAHYKTLSNATLSALASLISSVDLNATDTWNIRVDVLNPRGARPRVSGFVQGVGSSLHQIESTFLQGAITALSLLASGAANIDGGNLVADSYG